MARSNKSLNDALHSRKSGRHAQKKGKRASRALTKKLLNDVLKADKQLVP